MIWQALQYAILIQFIIKMGASNQSSTSAEKIRIRCRLVSLHNQHNFVYICKRRQDKHHSAEDILKNILGQCPPIFDLAYLIDSIYFILALPFFF